MTITLSLHFPVYFLTIKDKIVFNRALSACYLLVTRTNYQPMIKFGLFGLQVSEWNCKDNTYKRGLFSLQNNQTGLFLIMWNEIHIISKKWNINQQINTIVSPTNNQSPACLLYTSDAADDIGQV